MIDRNWWLAATAVMATLCDPASASTCVPPADFVDSPSPRIALPQELVAHTEYVEVARGLRVVLEAASRPLKDQIQQSDSLPGVSGSYMLTKGAFGTVGSRRLNCLTDGSTLVEQVLHSDDNRFRYVVWNYTSEKAQAVDYGVGEFLYSPVDKDRTRVTWTYSFKLDSNRFPGMLGPLGRYLFRTFFLDRQYASMMRGVLESMKRQAESAAPQFTGR